jgi:hypothetical protein
MSDRIILTIPRQRSFHGVAHLVLGGLAARLHLTVENLEDLQVALDALLEHSEGADDVTVELGVARGSIEAEVGPFDAERLRAAMTPGEASFNLQRVLSTVVDEVELTRDGRWIRLTKAVQPATEAA